jgi:hypothetical protein
MKRLFPGKKAGRRGQSFTELALIMLILALVLAGVVEYGFLLNAYLHVLDAAREGARVSSNSNPFLQDSTTHEYDPGQMNPYFYAVAAAQVASTLDPIGLNPSTNSLLSDDVVVSVFSEAYAGNPPVVRFPLQDPQGWSMCRRFGQVYAYFHDYLNGELPNDLNNPKWTSGNCVPRASKFSSGDIQSRLNSNAPGTGMLLVEVYYHYSQVLKLPVLTSLVPDPMEVYTYTIMPLSAAEPTPTP